MGLSENYRLWKLFILLFLQIYLSNGLGFPFRGGLRYLHDRAKKTYNMTKIELKLIQQPIDHFDNTSKTWKMRYCQDLEFYKTNGPIYLLIGGEGPLEEQYGLLASGLVYNLAKETNGAMILSEHRYYGKSLPIANLVTENMKYLSSKQALADLATLIKHLKSSFKSDESPDQKLVVVGGSYAGNLAAWMRLLYSDLVDAAMSISGPVLAKVDFMEYAEMVGNDFLQYGTPGCYDKITQKFKSYENLLSTPKGIKELKKKERICHRSDMTNKENQNLFFMKKSDELAGVAQYGSTFDFKIFCEQFKISSRTDYSLEGTIDELPDQKCIDVDFHRSFKTVDSWTYQTCTEFGFFQTFDSNNQPFTHNLPLDFFFKMCATMFGPNFDKKTVEDGVKATNALYGGRNPKITKVVYVNGDTDPWHTLSVLKNLSDDAPAILIPKSSHCEVMFDIQNESIAMKQAKTKIKSLIKSWIGL